MSEALTIWEITKVLGAVCVRNQEIYKEYTSYYFSLLKVEYAKLSWRFRKAISDRN